MKKGLSMTEDSDQITEQNPVPVVPEPELTAGALIHRAREAAGLHIAALAVSLKVPVKRLEALEADRYDLLPDAVFVRALAGSVCRTLKVDSTEILRLLPSQSTPRLGHWSEGRRKLEGATISTRQPTLSGTISRPAIVGGLVLVLGALALVFLPPLDFFSHKTDVTEEGGMVITPPMPVMAVEPSNPNQETASPATDTGSANAKSSAVVSGSVLSAAEGVQTGPPPTTGIVVFRPTAESWVEVTDTKGTVLLRRKLNSGEVAGATGALPLSVIVGRADVTKVHIRGQAFDLTPVSRDNVARFEVK
jgi:cytoskeleton protein RodZ